jgi:hypothetical protein
MGNPSGTASNVLKTLKPDGTWMIVEPFANDKLEDNLNPVGRVFYAAFSLVCVPASLAYNGPALGAQAGEYPISQLVKAAGFKHFKRATQTPFNLIYEANPRHVCLLTNSKHAVRSLILTQTLSFEIFTK